MNNFLILKVLSCLRNGITLSVSIGSALHVFLDWVLFAFSSFNLECHPITFHSSSTFSKALFWLIILTMIILTHFSQHFLGLLYVSQIFILVMYISVIFFSCAVCVCICVCKIMPEFAIRIPGYVWLVSVVPWKSHLNLQKPQFRHVKHLNYGLVPTTFFLWIKLNILL